MQMIQANEKAAEDTQQQEILPQLSFKLDDRYFALDIRNIVDIVACPDEVVTLPDAPAYVRGVINLRGQIIPLVPLRELLGIPSIESEYNVLSDMLDARKQDHINWAKELDRCVQENAPFKLATDPHKCAFGKWYYGFEPKSPALKRHLTKIEEPHCKLHAAATAVTQCNLADSETAKASCEAGVLSELHMAMTPQLLQLLEEAKEVFKDSMREMVLVLESAEHGKLGLVADEVLSVGQLRPVKADEALGLWQQSPYVAGLAASEEIAGTIVLLSDTRLLQLIEG